jgi:flagellar biosynthesis/type III secretory pathway protein FliH
MATAYIRGYQAGVHDGQEEGYQDGHEAGYEEGHEQGYQLAQDTVGEWHRPLGV